MAKNPLITDEVRRVVAEIYLKHSGWRAKEIRDGVEARLREQNPHSKPGWPGLSAVQKELTKIRASRLKQVDNHQDIIWSLYSYYDFEIPPDALPTVLKVWLIAREEDSTPITNREVKWIVRLYKVIKDLRMLKDRAKSLAFSELIGEILNIAMMGHPQRPLTLIEDMTGKKFSEEEAASIRLVKSPDYVEEVLQHLKVKN